MSSVYEALERARRESGGAAPARRPAAGGRRFPQEMQALAGRLQPLFDERPSVQLAITACGRGEGATTLASEFSAHMAEDGRRVLFCGVHGAGGNAGGEAPVIREAAPNLWLLDISTYRAPGSSLADKSALRDRLETLRERFQAIVIDCPPILIDGSWSPILRAADGVILMVEAEKTRSAVLRSTVKMIGEVGGHILGIVFNRRRQYIPRILYRFL